MKLPYLFRKPPEDWGQLLVVVFAWLESLPRLHDLVMVMELDLNFLAIFIHEWLQPQKLYNGLVQSFILSFGMASLKTDLYAVDIDCHQNDTESQQNIV